MGTLSGKYVIGEPIDYTSIYGYGKRRFPIFREGESSPAGHVKEELLLNGDGQEVGKAFCTRNLPRPNGAKRFYDSVESLVLAFGGEIARKKVIGLTTRAKKAASAAKRRVTKAPVKTTARKKKVA